MSRQRVIIIGGGFGGLTCAQKLRRAPVDVIVLDRTNHHLFQPLLYQVASAALSPGDISAPIREILRNQKNATVLMAEVEGIDLQNQQVRLDSGELLGYDWLVVAVGARHSYFGHGEWERHAPGLKSLGDALEIRRRMLRAWEAAERSAIATHGTQARADARSAPTLVVIGGGPTGVEMAGAIAEIAQRTLRRNFRRIDPARSRVILLEGAERLLTAYPSDLGESAQRQLESLGVEVRLSALVTEVTADRVHYRDGQGSHVVDTRCAIWAAGNQAPAILRALESPLDRQGRVEVEPDLTVPNHPEVFVIGDAAHAADAQGNPLPGTAPVAMQQGRYVAHTLRQASAAPSKAEDRAQRAPFRYRDKGSMATIGRARAVAWVGSLHVSGLVAWLMWCLLHVFFLVGFRNRIAVMAEWIYLYFTGRRSARILYRPASPAPSETDRGDQR